MYASCYNEQSLPSGIRSSHAFIRHQRHESRSSNIPPPETQMGLKGLKMTPNIFDQMVDTGITSSGMGNGNAIHQNRLI